MEHSNILHAILSKSYLCNLNNREVSEWLKEPAWKACICQKCIEGSNPFLSATQCPESGHFLFNESVRAAYKRVKQKNEQCDEGAGIGLTPPPGSRAKRVLPSSLQPTTQNPCRIRLCEGFLFLCCRYCCRFCIISIEELLSTVRRRYSLKFNPPSADY